MTHRAECYIILNRGMHIKCTPKSPGMHFCHKPAAGQETDMMEGPDSQEVISQPLILKNKQEENNS